MVPARRLAKTSRLNDSKVFLRLLQGRRRVGDCLELAIARDHGRRPRLGIVVAKKYLPRAVDRNAFKRILREAFRERQNRLAPCDMLLRLRQSLKGQPPAIWRPRVAEAVRKLLEEAGK